MEVGKRNRLKVLRSTRPGLYLDGEDGVEILLPRRYVPESSEPGQFLDVFVYRDSEDRLIATTDTPKIMVGQCAYLRVVAVNQVGAFLDWGLPKDLLVPFGQQAERMEAGKSYVVTAYLDAGSNRVVASSRLGRWLREEGDRFRAGQAVELLIAVQTDLGWKAVINHTHVGLVFKADVTQELAPGMHLPGFIKRIRSADQRIDLVLSQEQSKTRHSLEDEVVAYLLHHGGRSTITDSTAPEVIQAEFGVSKGSYKKALGALYRARRIVIGKKDITLVQSEESEAKSGKKSGPQIKKKIPRRKGVKPGRGPDVAKLEGKQARSDRTNTAKPSRVAKKKAGDSVKRARKKPVTRKQDNSGQ